MITVVGWPRSGTHWLKAMLECALGEEVGQSHIPPQPEGEYVLIVRDPRDTFASHWRLYRHDNPGAQITQLEFVDLLLKGGMESHQGWNIGWVAHTRKLIESAFPMVYYESLYARPELTLAWLVGEIGRPIQMRRIMEAVWKTRDVRCDPSTLPVDVDMGLPGKWREQLEPETVRALLDYCGETMAELGYGE